MSNVPIIGVKVSNMVREENGVGIPIDPQEYRHRLDYKPSRNVLYKKGEQRVNFGVVEEIPKKIQGNHRPPNSKLKIIKSDDSIFRECDKRKICVIDQVSGFRLNKNNLWVLEVFRNHQKAHPGSVLINRMYDLFDYFYNISVSYMESFHAANLQCDKSYLSEIPEWYGESKDGVQEYGLNVFLLGILNNYPIPQLIEKIERARE